jgi:hypothetical protein
VRVNEWQQAVRAVYVLHTESADAILCDPATAAGFAREVNARTGLSHEYLAREVLRCLLTLRKTGKLPRKGRSKGE